MVLVLRGGGSLRHRRGGLARGEEGRSVGSARAVRQGVRTHMDGYAPKIALGLGLRHDCPQYTAHQFQGELAWLGIRSTVSRKSRSATASRNASCGPVLYLHDVESLEEARQEIWFIEYNRGWLGAAIGPRPRSVRSSP